MAELVGKRLSKEWHESLGYSVFEDDFPLYTSPHKCGECIDDGQLCLIEPIRVLDTSRGIYFLNACVGCEEDGLECSVESFPCDWQHSFNDGIIFHLDKEPELAKEEDDSTATSPAATSKRPRSRSASGDPADEEDGPSSPSSKRSKLSDAPSDSEEPDWPGFCDCFNCVRAHPGMETDNLSTTFEGEEDPGTPSPPPTTKKGDKPAGDASASRLDTGDGDTTVAVDDHTPVVEDNSLTALIKEAEAGQHLANDESATPHTACSNNPDDQVDDDFVTRAELLSTCQDEISNKLEEHKRGEVKSCRRRIAEESESIEEWVEERLEGMEGDFQMRIEAACDSTTEAVYDEVVGEIETRMDDLENRMTAERVSMEARFEERLNTERLAIEEKVKADLKTDLDKRLSDERLAIETVKDDFIKRLDVERQIIAEKVKDLVPGLEANLNRNLEATRKQMAIKIDIAAAEGNAIRTQVVNLQQQLEALQHDHSQLQERMSALVKQSATESKSLLPKIEKDSQQRKPVSFSNSTKRREQQAKQHGISNNDQGDGEATDAEESAEETEEGDDGEGSDGVSEMGFDDAASNISGSTAVHSDTSPKRRKYRATSPYDSKADKAFAINFALQRSYAKMKALLRAERKVIKKAIRGESVGDDAEVMADFPTWAKAMFD